MSHKPVTQKIINSAETCVDDSLRGLVAVYPTLRLHPRHRVVTVRTTGDTKRVAVLGGGGSGHEPFAGGLVGAGMLTGAVAGGVFASPPTGHVLYAITHLYQHNSGGVIVIIGNYTGDRLNFGKAIEKAKIAGVKVEGLIVGEDVASSHNKTGGRSMCGEVFFHKICGAMAERGYDLATIKDVAAAANKAMATLGVCLTACSLPGQPPLFEVAPGVMELGAGVHGEAGIDKLKVGPAKEVVALIVDEILADLKLKSGDRVAVMVDNLGGTSFMEMNIISADIKDYLESKGITAERIFSGHFKTSLEMHGFQICLLHLTQQHGALWLELLDAPTNATGWVGGPASVGGSGGHWDDESLPIADATEFATGPSLDPRQQQILKASVARAARELMANEALLNRLDSGCGDGDCGITLKKFGTAILSYLETAPAQHPARVLWELSELAETDMGGTSGGVYSLGLAAAAQTAVSAKSMDAATWLAAWESGMHAITKYGGAEPGDRTMLDTLHAAAVAFRESLGRDLEQALRLTDAAAERGTKSTANMVARAGRASYVASDYTRDEDAGARAAAIWLHAILDSVASAL